MSRSETPDTPARSLRPLLVTLVVLLPGYFLAGTWFVMPSERLYVAWPVAWVCSWLSRPRAARASWRLWAPVVACVAAAMGAALAFDLFEIVPGFAAWLATRTVYCMLGWLLLLGCVRSAVFAGLRGAAVRRPWLPRAVWAALFVALLGPIILSYMQIHPIKRRPRSDPLETLGVPFEDVAFQSADGTHLAGWYVRADDPKGTVLLVHGVMDHSHGVIDFLRVLHAGSYNVLVFDFRAHGRSQGWTVTYGAREKADVVAALDFLEQHDPTHARHVLGVGWSMGAASLILAAAEDRRLVALHLDSPYASTRDMALHIGRGIPPGLNQWMFWAGTALASLEAHCNLFDLSPQRAVASVSPRPLMIVHGDRDQVVPLAQGRKVFEAAREPKSFHVVPGAGHCQTLLIDETTYAQRMLDFLDSVRIKETR